MAVETDDPHIASHTKNPYTVSPASIFAWTEIVDIIHSEFKVLPDTSSRGDQ